MIHNKFRYLLTLVALFAISTGAWADVDAPNTKTFTVPDTWQHVFEAYTAADLPADFAACSDDEAAAWAAACTDEYAVLIYSIGNVYTKSNVASKDSRQKWQLHQAQLMGYKIYYTPAPDVEVAWDASTKTGTFAMPGSDVVLTPQYAPAAQLDENGAPAAVSGLEIAADAAIITAGQSAQGTLLYAVGTSATEKPALTAFAATLPNAKDLTAAGNYYVWYYIQGQDTPQGQEPTAENTFNDSEIMGPVMVELLTNEHTLNIKQSPNITVTVAGTAKAVTDDKVTPVTTGQEVKIKAKDGYKFRKVEVKKAGPAADIVWDGTNVSDLHVEGNYLSYTKEGIKLSGNAEQVQAEWNNSAYLGTPGMEFITMESGGFTFTAPTGKAFTKIEMKAVGDGGWATENLGTGWAYNTGTVTWTGSAASTVKLLKDADMFSGDFISSIAFYLSE